MRLAAFELLEQANDTKDEAMQIRLLKEGSSGKLDILLQHALNPQFRFDLPEGDPPYKPNIPANSENNLWQQMRKLYVFCKKLAPALKENRRQMLFVETLETVHPKDAELLLSVKDQNWPYQNVSIDTIRKAYPGIV